MQISYFHVPAEMPQDLRPDAAVVIDVLRATTTIAWSLHNGAEAVQAFANLDDLRAAAAAWPADARLLLGERGGQMLEGFDLGNSPVAVTPERVAGKRLFMSTTNGTRALDRVREVPLLLTACLLYTSDAADDRHMAGLFRQQTLGHGIAVRQRCRQQQRNLADTIESPGAIGGAHEQTLASYPLRRHGNG